MVLECCREFLVAVHRVANAIVLPINFGQMYHVIVLLIQLLHEQHFTNNQVSVDHWRCLWLLVAHIETRVAGKIWLLGLLLLLHCTFEKHQVILLDTVDLETM